MSQTIISSLAEMMDPHVRDTKDRVIQRVLAEADRRIRTTIKWRLRQNLRRVALEIQSDIDGKIVISVEIK